MGTNGVGGTGDVKWTKTLFDKLDVKDGKPADGKIEASIWNGFLESIGSKGNTIERFITFERAEKSFEYYKNTKDKGDVDWSDPDALLKTYEDAEAAKAAGNGEGVVEKETGAKEGKEVQVKGMCPPEPTTDPEKPAELTEAQRAGQLAEVFGENKEVEAHIEAKATGIGNDFDGKIKLPDGAKLEEGKLPEVLFMSLPKAYGGKYMKLTLVDADKGVYTTTASNRKFQIEINDGKVTMKAYETEELEPKLKADQIKYGTRIPVPPKEDDAAAKVRKQAQANINASVDFLAEVAYKDPKPEVTTKTDKKGTYRTVDIDGKMIQVEYNDDGTVACVKVMLSDKGKEAHELDVSFTNDEISYNTDYTNTETEGSFAPDNYKFSQILELVEKIFGPGPTAS